MLKISTREMYRVLPNDKISSLFFQNDNFVRVVFKKLKAQRGDVNVNLTFVLTLMSLVRYHSIVEF